MAMLTLLDRQPDRNCQGFCRREFLRIGCLGLGTGLGLPDLLASRAQAAADGRLVKDRSRSARTTDTWGSPRPGR
jgi:hypothetical protein